MIVPVLAMLMLLVPPAVVIGAILDACYESDAHPGFADVRATVAVDAERIAPLIRARAQVQLNA